MRKMIRAAAVAAKHVALVPLASHDEDYEEEDFDGGPTCPRCGAEVQPEDDDCWWCGEEL